MPRPRSRLTLILGLFTMLLPGLAQADDPEKPGVVVPSDPVFEALRTDNTTANGRIAELRLEDGQGQVVLVGDGDQQETIDLSALVKLTRQGESPPYPPEGSLLVLPDGDRLRTLINRSDQVQVEALPFAMGDVAASIPLDRILGLVLAPPSDPGALETLLGKIRREPRDGEVLWHVNGDRLTGRFLGLDAKTIAFDSGHGREELDRSGIVALGFDPALISYPKPESAFLELGLADGSRLGLTACRIERGQLVAETRLGPTFRLPLKELSRIHVRGGSVAYLSDRAPARSIYIPYLDRHPETFGRDATWDGHHLALAGQPYDHGLGMLPRTLLAYPIEPGDARFQALIGLDDRAGDQASVVFRVLVDRREAFVSPLMTRRSEPIAVDVDLDGGRFLILVVEFGERGDVQDSADWIEARLIRK